MRILSLCANLGRGGTQRVVQNFTFAYRRAGHEAAVLAWSEGGVRQVRLEQSGVPVFVGVGSDSMARAREFAPDVIHIHRAGVADPLQTDLLKQLKRGDCRVVETNVFSRVDRSAGGNLIDIHFQLTNWCMWKWRRWLGREQRAGVIVPNAVEASDFPEPTSAEIAEFRSANQIPPDAFLAGRVGQPEPGKWHPVNLRAFVEIAERDSNAYLVLLGLPPEFRGTVDAMPADVRRRVRVLPVVDTDQTLRALYGSIDCFLHAASTGESFGLVLTEAMLCNAPCVTVSRPFKDNSQIEVVRQGVDGLVAGSIDSFRRAAMQMWEQKDFRQRIRPGLRAGVIERYGADKVAAAALKAMQYARQHTNRAKLIDALETDPTLKTDTTDAEAMQMLRNTIGGPATTDVLRMKVMHSSLVHRSVQLYLELTLYRRLRKKYAQPLKTGG